MEDKYRNEHKVGMGARTETGLGTRMGTGIGMRVEGRDILETYEVVL